MLVKTLSAYERRVMRCAYWQNCSAEFSAAAMIFRERGEGGRYLVAQHQSAIASAKARDLLWMLQNYGEKGQARGRPGCAGRYVEPARIAETLQNVRQWNDVAGVAS